MKGSARWRRYIFSQIDFAAVSGCNNWGFVVGDHIMKLKLLGLVACTALLGASQVGAATLDGTTSAATGIGGLVVDGTTYDVTFTYNTYNSVYSSSPTFLGNSSGASDAATALSLALTSLGVTAFPGTIREDQAVLVPDANVSGVNSGWEAYCTDSACTTPTWATDTYGGNDDSAIFDYVVFASFSPTSSTPLPAALPLFASGLGALGLFGWRRKRKNGAAFAAA